MNPNTLLLVCGVVRTMFGGFLSTASTYLPLVATHPATASTYLPLVATHPAIATPTRPADLFYPYQSTGQDLLGLPLPAPPLLTMPYSRLLHETS